MVRQPSTLNYWQGWAYLGTSIFASARYTIYLVKYDPALLQRRQQAGPSHEKEPAQKIIVLFNFAAFVTLIWRMSAIPPLCWIWSRSRTGGTDATRRDIPATATNDAAASTAPIKPGLHRQVRQCSSHARCPRTTPLHCRARCKDPRG
jgi:hypothetical protein